MPKFFFDFYEDDQAQIDDTGLELSGIDEAEKDAAATLARDVADHEPDGVREAYVQIRDEAGEIVSSVSATFRVEIRRPSPLPNFVQCERWPQAVRHPGRS